jgi:site-specific recombinase XerD
MNLKYPTVTIDHRDNVFITFYKDKKRYRISNGEKIGIDLKPNSFPTHKKYEMGLILASEVYRYLQSNKPLKNGKIAYQKKRSDLEYLELALEKKLKSTLSKKYLETLEFIYLKIKEISKDGDVNEKTIEKLLSNYVNATSYNTIRTHLSALISEAMNLGLKYNPMQHIKRKRQEARLHKPFKNINTVLNEIKDFHTHLYLCCLLTYGCLLRPHREIRELTWNDFSNDLNYINLSGARNKSKKNRIVPVPEFVKNELCATLLNNNIFSNKLKPFNPSYFKTLWVRFKKQSNYLEENQTLYSFRHSGAIDIFKRTGSLHKLQSAMGHSSLLVTTAYLRGLEVCEINKEDMPVL